MSNTDNSSPIETPRSGYTPGEVEAKWTRVWFDNGVFDLEIDPNKPKFSIALPPPNITGNLHMGHALNGTLQDMLIRLKRMQGYNVLWQAGTDHAGISAQMVVERRLKKEGRNRREMGREAFVKEIWQWRDQSGGQIFDQYKKLGVSFNWNRLAFTLDDSYVRAIYRVFVTLFREGFIYRGNRVTNWCPRCLTSLSDLEVVHEETEGCLYQIEYKLCDGSGVLTVATTRPETLFGDVAVAVHPNDDRYKNFIGKMVKLPLTDRELPVIGDAYVDRQFGTGVLKITPAHDASDWAVGQRHKLPSPAVIDAEGRLLDNSLVPLQFHKMDRVAAREAVIEQLTVDGSLRAQTAFRHGVGHCERCHTVIEPYLSDQWYVSMKELAEPAIKAVEDRRVVFIPERYASTYLDWMRNIRDWNISRQLWWGHRIPVWTCANNHVDAYEEAPSKCTKCDSTELTQDADVLDTWFSSALWPFATLGWPEQTKLMDEFYPTAVLSTAREIINLWVSRMIFMSLKFVKTIPFQHVLIHPVVQTKDGKRMSKSKGNAVDPLDMIAKYGADANRLYFCALGVKGDQDVRFREERVEEYSKFANKLFNAGKFVATQLEGFTPSGIDKSKLTLADRWILNLYNTMLGELVADFEGYDFHEAARKLYSFTWDCFCDWYLEIAKSQIAEESAEAGQTRAVLYAVFEGLLRALHPIMPFITEELWSKLPKSPQCADLVSVMFAPYPRSDERYIDDEADAQMELILRIIRTIRAVRATFSVPASAAIAVALAGANLQEVETLKRGRANIEKDRACRVAKLTIEPSATVPPRAATQMVSSVKVIVPLDNVIDVEKAKAKLEQRQAALEKDCVRVRGQLGNAEFLDRAPKERVDATLTQLRQLQEQLESLNAQLKVLEA